MSDTEVKPLEAAPEKIFRAPCKNDVITFRDRRYCIEDQIGQGGFGAVFACTDDWGNRLVAKVLLPKDRSYEQVESSWLQELKNLVELRHPNITYVYDAFECFDTFYLIMERCDTSFEQLIQWPEFIGKLWFKGMARCVLQAIHFIHSRGYIHKDIHPGNVFTSYVRDEMLPDDTDHTAVTFKVADLGISRLAPEVDVFNTLLAQWMLPPEYLNPTEFGTLSHQIDIYHAGLLLLSVLSGKIPTFTKEEILEGKPRIMAEELQHPAAPAIAKALRRHVSQRTPTALEFWYNIQELTKH